MKKAQQENHAKPLYIFSLFFFLFITFPLLAEHNFSFRAAPAFEVPLGIAEFSPGIGAKLSLDWSFFTFSRNFDLGVTAGGAFASLPVVVGDPLTLLEGYGGVFLRYRPSTLFGRNAERWEFRTAAAAGAYNYSRSGASAINPLYSFALGTEFHLSPYLSLFADTAYTYRPFSSEPLQTISAALGLRLNLSEIMDGRARVQMERTRQYRVFPVSWAWYEHNPVAAVTVTNNEPNAITDVRLSFFMDSFMGEPWTFAVIPHIAAGESAEVPVTALFNEALINLTQNINANGIVQIQYRSLGARKETSFPLQMPIFQRNTMSWDDDRRAAAFVSPRDYSARLFAHNAVGAAETMPRQGDIPRNVLYAAALFEALRLYGISYIVDPASSFIAMSADESALDSLNFPYETLFFRGGDCDDLSILFCSLLEAVDIESAFITIPGHIFIAFSVNDDNWQAGNPDIIALSGSDGILRRWLPVEVTVPSRGFSQGWRIGARQWRDAGAEAALYPIREAWEIYPSVTVPASGDNPPEVPNWADIINAVNNELRGLGR